MIRGLLLVVIAGACVTAGCARPQAVREVATASQPVVLGIQRSGNHLHQRFQLQREAFAGRAADLERLTATARARAEAIERKWRFAADEKKLKQLTGQLAILREKDEQLRADPLAAIAVPVSSETKADKINLAPLAKTLAALDQLKGAQRMTWQEFVAFGQATNEELAKLEQESVSAAPANAAPQP